MGIGGGKLWEILFQRWMERFGLLVMMRMTEEMVAIWQGSKYRQESCGGWFLSAEAGF